MNPPRPFCRFAVFDLDGTILDTLEDLNEAVNFALRSHHLPGRTLTETRAFVGHGIRNLVERSSPAGTAPETLSGLLETFKEYYRLHNADRTRPYPGILPMLTAIRAAGIRTAVVSNKADFAVQALCRRFFPGLFDFVAGEQAGIAKKPAPDLVFKAMNAVGIPAEESVYIGDSDVDFQTAENAGVRAILVTWGFRDESLLRSLMPAEIACNTAELQEILLNSREKN